MIRTDLVKLHDLHVIKKLGKQFVLVCEALDMLPHCIQLLNRVLGKMSGDAETVDCRGQMVSKLHSIM